MATIYFDKLKILQMLQASGNLTCQEHPTCVIHLQDIYIYTYPQKNITGMTDSQSVTGW